MRIPVVLKATGLIFGRSLWNVSKGFFEMIGIIVILALIIVIVWGVASIIGALMFCVFPGILMICPDALSGHGLDLFGALAGSGIFTFFAVLFTIILTHKTYQLGGHIYRTTREEWHKAVKDSEVLVAVDDIVKNSKNNA